MTLKRENERDKGTVAESKSLTLYYAQYCVPLAYLGLYFSIYHLYIL